MSQRKDDGPLIVLFGVAAAIVSSVFILTNCAKNNKNRPPEPVKMVWVNKTFYKVKYKLPDGSAHEEDSRYVDFRWLTDTVYFNNKEMSTQDVVVSTYHYWKEVPADRVRNGREVNE